MNLNVVIENGEDGYLVAYCPALPGCVTQGKTEEEVLKRIREAVDLYLAADPVEEVTRPFHKVVQIAV